MKTKILTSLLISATAAMTLSAAAADADLQKLHGHMKEMQTHMTNMQAAFFSGDKKKTLVAAEALNAENQHLLANERVMRSFLDPKGKAHQVRIALTSATQIDNAITMMQEYLGDSRRDARLAVQAAYFDIERACMTCHNLVRD